MARWRALLLRFNWARTALAAMLGSCLTCLCLLPGTIHALDPNKHVTQYLHTSWRIQDGSAPAGMFSITQTADGFLWFASLHKEVYRFDGVRFVPRTVSFNGKTMNTLGQVYGDRTGGLWALGIHDIAHLKGGVVVSHFEFPGFQPFQQISEDPDGSLWVVRGFGNPTNLPLCHVSGQAIKCFGQSDGIPVSEASSLLADGQGGFWMGGLKAVVHWRNGVSQVYPIEPMKPNEPGTIVRAILPGPNGSLWVGIMEDGPGRGLETLAEGKLRSFVAPGFDGKNVVVYNMAFDRDGSLWVGTAGKGLFRIRGNVVEHYGQAEGLSSDDVRDLFEDREGILWVATNNGIDSFRDPRVTTFSTSEGLGHAVAGVLAGSDGSIWVANDESLDHIGNGSVSSIRQKHGLPGGQVTALLEDSARNLWVGVDSDLYLFKDGHFRRVLGRNHESLGFVAALTQDVDGNVWAECVSNTRKLVRIRDFQVQEEFPAPKTPFGHAIAPDPTGGIWIATSRNGDLVHFRDGAFQTVSLNLSSPVVTQISAGADGSVLVASVDGLVGVQQGKAQRMTINNGLPCDPVISFVEDKEKRWWLYTDCGVVEFPDSELQQWWANPGAKIKTRVFDVLDGARPAGRPSFNAAAYSPDGRVWFASGSVLQMVDPSKLSHKTLPAETYIDSVTVDRKELAAINSLKLPPHPRDLQIDYTSPTFTIPQRVTFRYRLGGYDRDWHDAGTRRQAFYTDLPPGKYSFRVIAANSDGVWNDNGAKLDFSVAPAYYQTTWFRALCAISFMALLWSAYRLRVRQLRHQFEMTLDARVGERTRIARELHDTLLQSFHGLLLRFQTVSQLLPERPVEAKENLERAIEHAADAITEGRDAVQGLRDSTIQSNDLALAISTLGQELTTDSSNHRPAFHVAVEGESRNLHPIVRDEIYKIAAEALRNAFRHAQAQQIEVEIRYDNEQFRLRVRDDGKGIDPAVLSAQGSEGHYGLPGMRERAKIMGAKLTVWSEVDAGTELELRLPASLAYATRRKPSWWSQAFTARAKG